MVIWDWIFVRYNWVRYNRVLLYIYVCVCVCMFLSSEVVQKTLTIFPSYILYRVIALWVYLPWYRVNSITNENLSRGIRRIQFCRTIVKKFFCVLFKKCVLTFPPFFLPFLQKKTAKKWFNIQVRFFPHISFVSIDRVTYFSTGKKQSFTKLN